MRPKFVIVSALLAMATAFATPHAGAVGTPVIVSGPGSFLSTYTQPVIAVAPGAEVTYYNVDIQPHDVVADVRREGHTRLKDSAVFCEETTGACPLFWTPLIEFGRDTPILGLEDIEPGTVYDFICTIHAGMVGKLIALPL